MCVLLFDVFNRCSLVQLGSGYNKGLFLLTLYVALDYDFEWVILSILNSHELVQRFVNRLVQLRKQIG